MATEIWLYEYENTAIQPYMVSAAVTAHRPTMTSDGRHGNTFFFCSSVRTSLRTFAHGTSSGHQIGRHSGLPQPGLLRLVEYLSISGMKALSCAYTTHRHEHWERCNYLLFVVLNAYITAHVRPRYVWWPPDRAALIFAPSWLAAPRWIFQHERNKRAELCLQGRNMSLHVQAQSSRMHPGQGCTLVQATWTRVQAVWTLVHIALIIVHTAQLYWSWSRLSWSWSRLPWPWSRQPWSWSRQPRTLVHTALNLGPDSFDYDTDNLGNTVECNKKN